MKLFNEAMNDFRCRQFSMTTDEDEKRLLRGQNRWILLSNPDNLNHKDRGLLDEIKALNERVVEACLIREYFVSFFDALNEETARLRWRVLQQLVLEADIKEFNKFFKNLKKWMNELWDYFKHKTSSAIIEALNHKIKATKAAAYGYRNLYYFRLKILQRVGFLNSKFAPLPTRRPSHA
jgi:transposase